MTKFVKKSEINCKWYEIDAKNAVVGRLATIITKIIRGKNSPKFSPHMDHGDFVVVKNIEQILDNNSNSNKEENKDETDNKDNKKFMPNIDNVMTNIRKRIIGPIIILILFVIITLPKISHLMIKVLPKIKGKSGDINTLGNFLKGLLILLISY